MAKEATGMRTGRIYSGHDLLNPLAYEAMCQEPLIDDSTDLLVPVLREGAPHFRRLGSGAALRPAKRKGRSKRHDEWIKELLHLFNRAGAAVDFYTNFFDAGQQTHRRLLSFPPHAARSWFAEQRIIFPDRLYIQPDIAGRDLGVFSPLGIAPNVIIEVIDSHYPEIETFERLIQLSSSAHLVFFYILGIAKNNRKQKFNELVEESDGSIRIRFTYALSGGNLVVNGEAVQWEGVDGAKRIQLMHGRLLRSDSLR